MRGLKYCAAGLLLAAVEASCTFYTACPTGNGPGPDASGGTSPTAGSQNDGGATDGAGAGAGGDPSGGGGSSGSGGVPEPLTEGAWVNVTSNLARLPSECGNLSYATVKPDEDLVIIGVARQGLWGTRDGGESWERLGSEMDPEEITNRTGWVLFDPEAPDTFWEAGIYNGSGIFKTTDGGRSFTPQNLAHNDFVSVDFTDPDRQTLLASGHEQVHKLYLSTDGAATWDEIGDFMPDDAVVCAYPLVLDADTFLLGCGTYGGGPPGIFRSTDRGMSWTRVSDVGGATPPLLAKDGTMYWPLEGSGGITKSTDNGETWSEPFGVDVVTTFTPRSHPVELPDGRIAALSKRSVIITSDGGETWQAASPELPFEPGTFVYSPEQRAFFVFRTTCGTGTDPVPANGIQRFDFDVEAP